ncbi:MAG: hypothetical protein MRY64_14495, partial [Hyphomonadaceae bacterium]|nr:hypothetical protein [Hyphomonadaceae bacterium]
MYRLLSFILLALFLSCPVLADSNGEFPPASSDGECFARVLTPLISETIQEEVLVSPETYRIEVIPAVYEEHSESFLVKEASTSFRLIPAVTDIIEEQVMVEPERVEKIVIPAEFETYTETVEVEPAREVWKPGTGLFGRTAAFVEDVNAPAEMPTGEVLCRVLEPA